MIAVALPLIVLVAGATAVMFFTRSPLPVGHRSEADRVRIELLARFVDRSQRFRRNGAIVGLVVAAAVATITQSRSQQGLDLDVLRLTSIGLTGSIVGSILGEAFRTRSSPGPRVASLVVRDPAAYADRVADRREQVLLVLAAASIGGALLLETRPVAPVLAVLAVAVLAVVRRWAIRRIALRHRPVLTQDLTAADDEVRRLASSAGISRPIVTLEALLVSAGWFATVPGPGANVSPPGFLVGAATWEGVLIFGAACWWWWSNRSFGLKLERSQRLVPPSYLAVWILVGVAVLLALTLLVALARGA